MAVTLKAKSGLDGKDAVNSGKYDNNDIYAVINDNDNNEEIKIVTFTYMHHPITYY